MSWILQESNNSIRFDSNNSNKLRPEQRYILTNYSSCFFEVTLDKILPCYKRNLRRPCFVQLLSQLKVNNIKTGRNLSLFIALS